MVSEQSDWQQQLDELVALQSIYGEEFRLVAVTGLAGGSEDGVGFEELMAVDAPSDLTQLKAHVEILVSPEDTSCLEERQDASDNSSLNDESVEDPPPRVIRLGLKMGQGYPSEYPPEIEIHAAWLRPDQIIDLVHQLLALWSDQGPGQPIGFAWVDWLQTSSMEFLLQCEANNSGSQGSNDEGAANLLDIKEFSQKTWQCGICFDEVPGTACVRLGECGHFYCIMCLQQDWHHKVAAREINRLKCPTPECRKPIHVEVLQEYMIKDDYLLWQDLSLERAVSFMDKEAACPACKQAAATTVDPLTHHAKCNNCMFDFCALCLKPWHPTRTCVQAEGWALSDIAARSEEASGSSSQQSILQYMTQDLVNQLLSMRELKKSSKQCPSCHMWITKISGCNKMVCSHCDTRFCYRCGQQIDGYDHFSGNCELFPEDHTNEAPPGLARALEANNMPALGYYLAQAAAGQPGARIRRCPKCGQANVKEGQINVLRCWSCTCRMCYCCGADLQGKGATVQHFGPQQQAGRKKPCKQHGRD